MSTTELEQQQQPETTAAAVTDTKLVRDVLAHLREQLRSAERIKTVVDAQADAVRTHDVKAVVETACQLQVEITRRQVIEQEREELNVRTGALLGEAPEQVTLNQLISIMDADSAQVARERQTTLRKLLRRTQRRHTANQALMRQNLNFLSHLLGRVSTGGTYDAAGQRFSSRSGAAPQRRPTLDLEA